VDDHAISSAGLTAILAEVEGLSIVGTIDEPHEAARRLSARQAHMAIFNLSSSPDATVDITAQVLEETRLFEKTPTLLITPMVPYQKIAQLVKLGVQGCVADNVEQKVLIQVVLAIAAGCSVYFPSDIVQKLFSSSGPRGQPNTPPSDTPPLTQQERRVLGCVARGLSNQEIGRELALSQATVKKHLSQAMRKVRVRDRLQAAIYVCQHNLDSLLACLNARFEIGGRRPHVAGRVVTPAQLSGTHRPTPAWRR
jgi:DNA-binding NarL/FixJ family response regulator